MAADPLETLDQHSVPKDRALPGLRVRAWSALQGHALLRSATHIMLTTTVNFGLGYVYWILSAHLLAHAAVGTGSALIAAMTVCAFLFNLGTVSTVMERLPKAEDDSARSVVLTTALTTAAVGSTIGSAAFAALLPLVSAHFHVLWSPAAFGLFVTGGVSMTVAIVLDYVAIVERVGSNMVARNGFFNVTKILLLVAVATFGFSRGPLTIVGSWSIASVASLVVSFATLSRTGHRFTARWRGAAAEFRAARRSLAGHHLTNLGGQLPGYLLPIIVVTLLSPTANSYFYLTWVVGGVFFFVSPAVASALFAEGSHDASDLHTKVRQTAAIIAPILAIPMIVVIATGGLVLRVFGPDYPSHGRTLLLYLVLSAVPDAVTNVAVAVLRVRQQLRASAVLNGGMAALALVLAPILVERLGIAGAGLAWLIAQSAGAVVVLGVSWRERRRRSGASAALRS